MYLAAFRMPPSFAEINETRRRIVQTLVWFTSALIISVFVTNIQYAIALIGGLAALFIFFFPGKKLHSMQIKVYMQFKLNYHKIIEQVYIFS